MEKGLEKFDNSMKSYPSFKNEWRILGIIIQIFLIGFFWRTGFENKI
jgi:hypothetical protein